MSNLVLLIFLLLSILQNIGPPSVNVDACSGGRNKNGDDKETPPSIIPPSTSAITSSSSTPTTLATPTSPTTTTSSQLFLSKKVRRIVNLKYSESFGPYHNIYSWHMEVDDEAANLKVV